MIAFRTRKQHHFLHFEMIQSFSFPAIITVVLVLFRFVLSFSSSNSENIKNDTYLDIHVKLSTPSDDLILRLNTEISLKLHSAGAPQLINFGNDIPHVTLYLTEFTGDAIGGDLLEAVQMAIRNVTSMGGHCSCPSLLTSDTIGFLPDMAPVFPWMRIGGSGVTQGRSAMLNVAEKCDDFDGVFVDYLGARSEDSTNFRQGRPSMIHSYEESLCLQSLSNSIVNYASPFSTKQARSAIPTWVDLLPDSEEKRDRIQSIRKYGSPNVYQFFRPHVTFAAVKSEDVDILSAVIDHEFYEHNEQIYARIGEVGVGVLDDIDLGSVRRSGDLKDFPLEFQGDISKSLK